MLLRLGGGHQRGSRPLCLVAVVWALVAEIVVGTAAGPDAVDSLVAVEEGIVTELVADPFAVGIAAVAFATATLMVDLAVFESA